MTELATPTDPAPGITGNTHAVEPASYKDIDRAPLGVKLLSMVVVVAAILDLSLAALMVLNTTTANLQAETGLSRGGLVAYAIVVGALGLVAFAVGIGLRAGTAWARLVTIILALIRLVGLGFVMIAFSNRQWYTGIVPAVIYAVVAYYLIYDEEAKAYFSS